MWWLDFLCWQWGSCVFVVYYFAFIKYQTMYTQTQGVRGSIDCCFRMMDFPVRSVLRGSSYFDFQNLGPADLPHFIPCKIWAHGTQEDFTRPERCRLSFLEGSGKTDSLVESAKHFLCAGIWGGTWKNSRKLFNIFHSRRSFCDTHELVWTREIRNQVTHALQLPCLQTISWC